MSCNNNSNKASAAGLKSGISKIASKAAYAAGTAGGGVGGAIAGGTLGGVTAGAPGAVVGGLAGAKMGSKLGGKFIKSDKKAMAGAASGAIGGGLAMGPAGAPLGAIAGYSIGRMASHNKWLQSGKGRAALATYKEKVAEVQTQRRAVGKTFRAEVAQARQVAKQAKDKAFEKVSAAEDKYLRQEEKGAKSAGGLKKWERSQEGKAAQKTYDQAYETFKQQKSKINKTYRQEAAQSLKKYAGERKGANRKTRQATRDINAAMKRR